MQDNNTSAQLDDDEILTKVDSLLHKHQNQAKVRSDAGYGQSVSAAEEPIPSSATLPQTSTNEIPTLTEVVMLHPVSLPEQSANNSSLQKILDTALQEVGVALNNSERIALLRALEKHLINKPD